jgi:hypothetical protein
MNVDDVLADLLRSPLNEFTNRRNAKAKELKAAGQRELAEEVSGLKKPPVPVWAVNQLARGNTAILQRLKQAGEGVVQAQQGAVGGRKDAAPWLRSASDRLQHELEGAVRLVADRLRTDGHAADEATLRRVQEILRLAAVSGGETWDRLRGGTLIDEPKAGEDMLTAAFALGTPSRAAPSEMGTQGRAKETGSSDPRAAAKEAAQTEKRLAIEHAQRTAKTDEEAAQQAGQNAKRLREEADRLAADAKRASEKARLAEKESKRLADKAKSSGEAVRKLSRSGRGG